MYSNVVQLTYLLHVLQKLRIGKVLISQAHCVSCSCISALGFCGRMCMHEFLVLDGLTQVLHVCHHHP